MRIKSQRDFFSGLMFVVVGIIFAVGATNYSMGTSARPGAGYFPLLLSVIMAILGAIVLFKSLTIESPGGDPVGSFAWKPLIIIVLAITVFGLLLERVGMIITVPILIIMSSLAGDEFHWKGVLANAFVLTVGAWAVFVLGLKLTIPLWPRFFQ
ncbi:MAG: tripartite tricarboxylate transporter TctB family protein [Caldimonas sp.]